MHPCPCAISDPLARSALGNRIGIPAFYIAFVLAPLASNGSEFIASYRGSAMALKYFSIHILPRLARLARLVALVVQRR